MAKKQEAKKVFELLSSSARISTSGRDYSLLVSPDLGFTKPAGIAASVEGAKGFCPLK